MKNFKFKGELGLLIVAIIWGSGFVASDIALNYFTPIEVMTIRFFVAAIIMSIIFFKHIKKADKKNIIYGMIIGSILYTAFLLQTIGLKHTTPSKNAFITSINVVIVPFIGLIFFKRKLSSNSILGAILAVIGIGVISIESSLSVNIGDFLTLLCAFAFAFHIFLIGEFLKRGANPILLTSIQLITAFIISVFVLGFNLEVKLAPLQTNAILATIYLGVMSTCVAFFLQTISQKHTTETKAAIILCTEAIFGAVFSVIMLGEQLKPRTILGCVIIFSSIIILEIVQKK